MIGEALAEKENVEHSEGGVNEMKTNVFDNTEAYTGEVLSHSEFADIMSNAKRGGSLKEAFIAHGIEDINIMFPDHKSLMNEPEFIKDDNGWVAKVMGGVHHTPFSRIKTIFADITGEKARALGYIKGNEKKEEIFKLLKRTTNPTTVYKKQALDRDDVLDLEQNFNLLPFLKKEMRMKLDEELARAILIGDGRDPVEEEADKINEECIRPIWTMEDLFTVKVAVEVAGNVTDDDRARAFIKACKKSRKNYKGSGNPTMFMPEDMLTDCLLIEDKNGRVIYDTIDKLKAALRVSDIVPVPVMENLTRTDKDEVVHTLAGMYVNLKDYNVGTDKGGEVNFFDDFDIDYNQMKYLMETRCSGSLIKPYSAVAIEFTDSAQG
jgi:HK97 family phage major capsid protein